MDISNDSDIKSKGQKTYRKTSKDKKQKEKKNYKSRKTCLIKDDLPFINKLIEKEDISNDSSDLKGSKKTITTCYRLSVDKPKNQKKDSNKLKKERNRGKSFHNPQKNSSEMKHIRMGSRKGSRKSEKKEEAAQNSNKALKINQPQTFQRTAVRYDTNTVLATKLGTASKIAEALKNLQRINELKNVREESEKRKKKLKSDKINFYFKKNIPTEKITTKKAQMSENIKGIIQKMNLNRMKTGSASAKEVGVASVKKRKSKRKNEIRNSEDKNKTDYNKSNTNNNINNNYFVLCGNSASININDYEYRENKFNLAKSSRERKKSDSGPRHSNSKQEDKIFSKDMTKAKGKVSEIDKNFRWGDRVFISKNPKVYEIKNFNSKKAKSKMFFLMKENDFYICDNVQKTQKCKMDKILEEKSEDSSSKSSSKSDLKSSSKSSSSSIITESTPSSKNEKILMKMKRSGILITKKEKEKEDENNNITNRSSKNKNKDSVELEPILKKKTEMSRLV